MPLTVDAVRWRVDPSRARREVWIEGLEHPWGLAFLPDGSALVTERPGRLRVIRDGMLQPEPVAGVPAVFAQNQGGLLDVALHPGFADNRLVYLTYSHGTAEANPTRVA
ncbi:MAG: PQQ-dependent sugar dehydrogenase, partial [Lysobacteraceae bacterium]